MAGARKDGRSRRVAQTAPESYVNFMKAARAMRIAKGISTRTVAEKCGVTLSVISSWELCVTAPHPWDLATYLEAVGSALIVPDADKL